MTVAARRPATLPPLAAVLAFACLALLAWSSPARAAEESGAGTTTAEPPAVTDPGTANATAPPSPEAAGAPQNPAPQPDPVPSDPGPQGAAPDPPPDRGGDQAQPAGSGDSWEQQSAGGSEGSGNRDSGARDIAPAPGSTSTASAPALEQQIPAGLAPEGDLSLTPLTQFTVAPSTAANTGGSGAGAGLPSGGVRIGCLAVCPGGSSLATALRLALSHDARNAAREARERANGTAAEASAPTLLGLAGGAGAGLFNLLVTGGGSAAAIVFVGFLAVVMGLFALPREWSTSFRLPASRWKPSAYVTPIELPG